MISTTTLLAASIFFSPFVGPPNPKAAVYRHRWEWRAVKSNELVKRKEIVLHANGRITYKGFKTDGEALRFLVEGMALEKGRGKDSGLTEKK